jgi:hypothetical protein
MSYESGVVDGWPGTYWLELTSPFGDTELPIVPTHTFYCNVRPNEPLLQTHAIVRALNWWNALFNELSNATHVDY